MSKWVLNLKQGGHGMFGDAFLEAVSRTPSRDRGVSLVTEEFVLATADEEAI
ncbi:hypothetical protein HDU98_010532, partial [Podochytrium sp. JEL0797]